MATFRYKIRPGKDKNNPTNIYARFIDGRLIDIRAKTNLFVLPNYWVGYNDEGDLIIAKNYPGKKDLTEKLEKLKHHLVKTINDQPDIEKLNNEWLKTEIDKYNNPDKYAKRPTTFYAYIDDFIKRNESIRTPGTIKQYRNAKNRFQEFDEHRDEKSTFQNINMAWYKEFVHYSIKEKKLQNNSIAKYIKMLKTFLREAEDDEISVNPAYRSKKFSKPSNNTISIYLNDKEIKAIYALDLSKEKDKELDITRDLFVLGCRTGLRYSDYSNIKKENIKKNILEIRTIKTDTTIHVHLDSMARQIFKKYNYNLPEAPNNQRFNSNLKEIGLMAKINDEILVIKKVGSKRTETKTKKFMLIQSHTARRSFATNYYMEGKLTTKEIMSLTGHKSITQFEKYIKIDSLKVAQRAAKKSARFK